MSYELFFFTSYDSLCLHEITVKSCFLTLLFQTITVRNQKRINCLDKILLKIQMFFYICIFMFDWKIGLAMTEAYVAIQLSRALTIVHAVFDYQLIQQNCCVTKTL